MWLVHLAPQNIPLAISVLTLGSKLCCIVYSDGLFYLTKTPPLAFSWMLFWEICETLHIRFRCQSISRSQVSTERKRWVPLLIPEIVSISSFVLNFTQNVCTLVSLLKHWRCIYCRCPIRLSGACRRTDFFYCLMSTQSTPHSSGDVWESRWTSCT